MNDDTNVPQIAENVRDCTPDFPFGCATSWGRQLFSNWSEARAHVCNLAQHHDGQHECHCGDQSDGSEGGR